MVLVDIDLGDLSKIIIEQYGWSYTCAEVIANYIDDCCTNVDLCTFMKREEFKIYTDGESRDDIIRMLEEEGQYTEDLYIYEYDDCYFVELE